MSNVFTVKDNVPADGTNTLVNIERITFSDLSVALDLGITQSGGETALLIGAVLGKSLAFANDPIKQTVLGNVIALFDQSQYNMQILQAPSCA